MREAGRDATGGGVVGVLERVERRGRRRRRRAQLRGEPAAGGARSGG